MPPACRVARRTEALPVGIYRKAKREKRKARKAKREKRKENGEREAPGESAGANNHVLVGPR
jgi:hypothetical protein